MIWVFFVENVLGAIFGYVPAAADLFIIQGPVFITTSALYGMNVVSSRRC